MTEKKKNSKPGTERGIVKTKDFKQDLDIDSGKIAIVDASILDACNSPLVDKALIIPTKWESGVYKISVKFDDAALKKISIKQKKDQLGNMVEKMKGNPPDDKETLAKKRITDAKIAEAKPFTDRGNGKYDRVRQKAEGSRSAKITDTTHHKSKKRGRQLPDPSRRIVSAGRLPVNVNDNKNYDKTAEIMELIHKTSGTKSILPEHIESIKNKHLFESVVSQMYAMCLSGWKQSGNTVIHEDTGARVDGKMWSVKDGVLVGLDGKRPKIDFDWVYSAREAMKEYMAKQNVNIVEDILSHDRGIQG